MAVFRKIAAIRSDIFCVESFETGKKPIVTVV